MRTAFVNMTKDPITIADAKKRRVPWKTRTEGQIMAQLDMGQKTSPEAVNKIRQVLGFDKALKMKKKKQKVNNLYLSVCCKGLAGFLQHFKNNWQVVLQWQMGKGFENTGA